MHAGLALSGQQPACMGTSDIEIPTNLHNGSTGMTCSAMHGLTSSARAVRRDEVKQPGGHIMTNT